MDEKKEIKEKDEKKEKQYRSKSPQKKAKNDDDKDDKPSCARRCCSASLKGVGLITFRSFQRYQTYSQCFMVLALTALALGAWFTSLACFGDNNVAISYNFQSTPSTPTSIITYGKIDGKVTCAANSAINVPFSITSNSFILKEQIDTGITVNGIVGWAQYKWLLVGLAVIVLSYLLLILSSSCSRASNQWFAEQKRKGLAMRGRQERRDEMEEVMRKSRSKSMKEEDNVLTSNMDGIDDAEEVKVPGFCEDFPRVLGLCAGQCLFCFYYTAGMYKRFLLLLMFAVLVWFGFVIGMYFLYGSQSSLSINSGSSTISMMNAVFSTLPVLPVCSSGYILSFADAYAHTGSGGGEMTFTPSNDLLNPALYILGIIFACLEVALIVLFWISSCKCCSPG